MSTPSNPFVRAISAVVTGGLSEVPGQYNTAISGVKGLMQGDPTQGFKAALKGGSPMDALMPKIPQAPSLTGSPVSSPTTALATPASTLRARRNFSTLLTGSQGDTSNAYVNKSTLLGGTPTTLGR